MLIHDFTNDVGRRTWSGRKDATHRMTSVGRVSIRETSCSLGIFEGAR